ncbi:hypothetical protein AVEN_126665-1 [Araneus ventricosus]|uniref:Uncharacterized protein n=1 Tax=Araneus ventricosus TaxID=182803 RepID=A0A4Y2JGQ0_ARAVE|nr:hypothetical protein AVEN_126665-1 [Araneus ventricosus]
MQDVGCLDVDGLGMVVSLPGPPDHLIYLILIFFWNALKAIVYEAPVDFDMGLVASIAIAAAATIHKKSDILENVQ